MAPPPPPSHRGDGSLDAATQPQLDAPLPDGGRPLFAPGALVAARYRVVRFIAQGGMGQVYEAFDLELRERVALKTIRPALGGGEAVLERFKREILLARKVTHPNVCRIFDLGRHSAEGGADVLFLTMELLEGESLAARLRREGRLPLPEVRAVAAQIVAALAAAHRAGIVHRDLKPGNVMVVTGEDGAPRCVVTDFGLARGTLPEQGGDLSVGLAMGTAEYMAPEQVQGGPVGPAADVYALGIVLFELITGVPPFRGDTPLSTALLRLSTPAPSPRRHIAGLDRKWEAAILRCLERDPARRFQGVDELGEALSDGAGAAARPARRRGPLAVAALAAVAAASAAWWARAPASPDGEESRTPVAAVTSRRAVAVLGFKNLSGRADSAWLSTALAEMLTTELAAGEDLRTVPGENVSRMKADLALADAESLAPDTLARIRSHVGADVVVLGSYLALGAEGGGRLRLDVRLQDARAGETIAALAEQGTEADLFTVVARCGALLRDRMGASALSAEQAGAVRAARPATLVAARLYAGGLERLRLFDALAARDRLQQAVREDPTFAPAHAALAEAWTALGYEETARASARRAFDLASRLSREDRYAVEARYRETAREWPRAVEAWRALFTFFPDDLEYGVRLAGALLAAGRADEAVATLGSLRRLPAPMHDDPRLDVLEAQVAGARDDFRRQQALAERAAAKGTRLGAHLLVARARLEQAAAHFILGDLRAAGAAVAQARESSAAAGDRGGVAFAELQLANALWQQGRFAESTRAAGAALAGFRAIGNTTREGTALNRLAVLQHYQGLLSEAAATFAAARRSFERTGDRGGLAAVHVNLARLLRDQGDLLAARREHQAALRATSALGNRNFHAHALFGLGETLAAEGDLPGARKAHEEAMALWRPMGRRGPMGESQLALALLLIEEGRGALAEAPAREALAVFQAQGSAFNELHARDVLARALMAAGRAADARAEAERAAVLAQASEHPVFRLQALITAARLQAGPAEEARARLEAALREARRVGLPALELAARLARAERARQSGDPDAPALAAALERDARAKRHGLIARAAAALR